MWVYGEYIYLFFFCFYYVLYFLIGKVDVLSFKGNKGGN